MPILFYGPRHVTVELSSVKTKNMADISYILSGKSQSKKKTKHLIPQTCVKPGVQSEGMDSVAGSNNVDVNAVRKNQIRD